MADKIRLQGLEHVIQVTAHEGKVYLRSYRLEFPIPSFHPFLLPSFLISLFTIHPFLSPIPPFLSPSLFPIHQFLLPSFPPLSHPSTFPIHPSSYLSINSFIPPFSPSSPTFSSLPLFHQPLHPSFSFSPINSFHLSIFPFPSSFPTFSSLPIFYTSIHSPHHLSLFPIHLFLPSLPSICTFNFPLSLSHPSVPSIPTFSF